MSAIREALERWEDSGHTPSLSDFLSVFESDDNVWWALSSGDHLNLFEAALAESEQARRAVGWLVAAAGGSIVVPPNIMRQDFDPTAEDTLDGGRRFLSAPRSTRNASTERDG